MQRRFRLARANLTIPRVIFAAALVLAVVLGGTLILFTRHMGRAEAMIQHEGKYFLVEEGQSFQVKQKDRIFPFTVETIVKNRVTVAWETVQYEIEMSEPVTGD